MRRFLVAATILAAACGGKNTIPATPEIKTAAGTAQSGMNASATNTQAAIGLQSIGSDLGSAVAGGSVATLDLSTGLPAPATMAAAAIRPGFATSSQALRLSGSSSAAASSVVGCVKRAPGSGGQGTPTLYAAGQSGCTATDHLEVTYDTGDKVSITYTETTTSFDLTVAVIAGAWTGTNLHYQGSISATSASVSVSGAMKFSQNANPVIVDAEFNVTYNVSGSESASGGTVNISVNGTATDHVALARANQHWTLSMQSSISGQTQTDVFNWSGGIGVDLLKQDQTVDHSVAFNLNVRVTSESTATSGSVSWTASGDVEWDGSIVGNVVSKSNALFVDWTDGTEDALDLASLFGPMAV
jgi:hypothetical protein